MTEYTGDMQLMINAELHLAPFPKYLSALNMHTNLLLLTATGCEVGATPAVQLGTFIWYSD